MKWTLLICTKTQTYHYFSLINQPSNVVKQELCNTWHFW